MYPEAKHRHLVVLYPVSGITFHSIPLLTGQTEAVQFPSNGSIEFCSKFQHRIITFRIVHHAATLVAREVTFLVVLHHSYFRVDVVISCDYVVNESPAVVVVHVDARCRINYRLHRITRRTHLRLLPQVKRYMYSVDLEIK